MYQTRSLFFTSEVSSHNFSCRLIFLETVLLPFTLQELLMIHSYLRAYPGRLHNTQCAHVCISLLGIHPILCHTSIASGTLHNLSPMSHYGLSIPAFIYFKDKIKMLGRRLILGLLHNASSTE